MIVADEDDVRLVVMAAVAFNSGLKSRRDREPRDVNDLWAACERLGADVGLEVSRSAL